MRVENTGESGQLLFIWLPVGADINISGIKKNILNCVSLKHSSSNIVIQQGARNYWKASDSEWRWAWLAKNRTLKLYKAAQSLSSPSESDS